MRPLLGGSTIKGMAHITGGGITDNLPRVLPQDTGALVRLGSWDVPAIFRFLQGAGRVPQEDMLRTFNMGIGLIIVTAPGDVDALLGALAAGGAQDVRVVGEIVPAAHPSVTYS
jgi:phosphoribosylaminoimidazole (AIR) synthetase